jgi:hypothetical protein
MLLITEKVRITLKNEVVAKQKRLLHDTAIFSVDLLDFLRLIEIVPRFYIFLNSSPSGSYFTLEYSYQGNDYKYYMKEEQFHDFEQIAKEKNIKYKKHEV